MRESPWPLHPHPLDEECLLSWLARIASCYEFSLEDLLKYDLGFYGDPDDLNVNVPANLLKLLSKRSGILEENIYALTLSSWAPLLFDPFCTDEGYFESYVHHYSLLLPSQMHKKFKPKQRWKPWFSDQSIIFSKACPTCVTSDSVGAIRLAWCLSMMLSCPIHQCLLQQCHIYQGRDVIWITEDDPFISLSPAINKMDYRTWSALTIGKVALPRRTVHGGVWLRLLRTLLNELHIPASSTSSPYAKTIASIWASLDLKSRAGQLRWCPYEMLSLEKQQQTLMAAALAIQRIETSFIKPPGQHVFLFLPDPVNNKDLPSYSKQRGNSSKAQPESFWQTAYDSFNKCIENAKQDPIEAKNFRNLFLFGKVDFESVQRINKLLIDAGIPKEFLVL